MDNIQERMLEIGKHYHVYMSFCEGPGRFWVQLVESVKELDMLQQDIIRLYHTDHSESKLNTPVIGSCCVALYSDPGPCFYRAKLVRQIGQDSFSVYFLDYGNTQNVSSNEIRKIHPSIKHIQAHAIACSLPGQNENTPFIEIAHLQDCEDLKIKVLGFERDGVYSVQLISSKETIPYLSNSRQENNNSG